ncbi:MAG: 50S ribosomal protein L24 [Parcubacteria group bacterium]|nr:50S ribosomal protein L24 [Parcubacteria group bacterium]
MKSVKAKIKKGDFVEMLAGKDRKKRGKVLRVLPYEGKVVVEGLNTVRKHRRPKKSGEKGEVIQISRAVDISNVMAVCGKCGALTRVGFRVEGGRHVRMCKKCGNEI